MLSAPIDRKSAVAYKLPSTESCLTRGAPDSLSHRTVALSDGQY